MESWSNGSINSGSPIIQLFCPPLFLEESIHDRVTPEFGHGRNYTVGKFFVGPTPGMNAGAERYRRDLWRRVEPGEERQGSLAALQRHRVVVDAVDRKKV